MVLCDVREKVGESVWNHSGGLFNYSSALFAVQAITSLPSAAHFSAGTKWASVARRRRALYAERLTSRCFDLRWLLAGNATLLLLAPLDYGSVPLNPSPSPCTACILQVHDARSDHASANWPFKQRCFSLEAFQKACKGIFTRDVYFPPTNISHEKTDWARLMSHRAFCFLFF